MRDDQYGPGAMRVGDEERGGVLERTAFTAEEAARVERVLAHLVKIAGARCSLLVDRCGRVISSHGEAGPSERVEISGLAAASHELAELMTRLLGRSGILVARDVNVELTPVHDGLILATVFGQHASLSAIRLNTGHAAERLLELLAPAVRDAPGCAVR